MAATEGMTSEALLARLREIERETTRVHAALREHAAAATLGPHLVVALEWPGEADGRLVALPAAAVAKVVPRVDLSPWVGEAPQPMAAFLGTFVFEGETCRALDLAPLLGGGAQGEAADCFVVLTGEPRVAFLASRLVGVTPPIEVSYGDLVGREDGVLACVARGSGARVLRADAVRAAGRGETGRTA